MPHERLRALRDFLDGFTVIGDGATGEAPHMLAGSSTQGIRDFFSESAAVLWKIDGMCSSLGYTDGQAS